MSQPINEYQRELLKLLGNRVNAIRQEKGLTLEQVAFETSKERQSIHKLEKGSFNPSFLYLHDVCKGLGIDIKELFDFEI